MKSARRSFTSVEWGGSRNKNEEKMKKKTRRLLLALLHLH